LANEKSKLSQDLKKFLDKTYRFLSYRPRSQQEIQNYLQKKKAPPKLIDAIISKLKKQKLLDDQAFADWWVDQRRQFRPKGKMALLVELRQKGIDRETAAAAVVDVDETKLAKKALSKKTGSYQQLVGFLGRRGFAWSVIKAVLEEAKEK